MLKPQISPIKVDPWQVIRIPDEDLYKWAEELGNQREQQVDPSPFVLAHDEHKSWEQAYLATTPVTRLRYWMLCRAIVSAPGR